MSISYVAAGTAASTTSGTSVAPGIPAGLTNATDRMYMAVCCSSDKTGSFNTPSGWTKLGQSANSTSQSIVVYGKWFATGDGAPSVTWTGNTAGYGRIFGYRGLDLTTPEDVAISFGTGSSNAPTSPTITALTRGAARLDFFAINNAGNNASDWRVIQRSDGGTLSGVAHLTWGDEFGMAEGALGTRIGSSASAAWVAGSVWLRPATADSFGLLQSNKYVSTATAASHSLAYLNNLTSGSYLTAGVATYHGSGSSISSVTYASGTALSKTSEPDEVGTDLEVVGWHYQNNTNTTAATVVANVTGGAQDAAMYIAEWLGVPTSGASIDQSGTNTAASGTAVTVSTSSATSSGTKLSVMYMSAFNVESTFTGDSNYLRRWTSPDATHMSFFAQSREFSGGSTETATATLASSSEWEAGIVVMLKVSAVDPFPLLPKRMGQLPLYRM